MYAELSVVVGNYYGFFRKFRDDLSQEEMRSWPIVLEETKKKREEIVLARNKVLGLTQQFLAVGEKRQGTDDKLLYDFASAIRGFFYSSDDMTPGTKATSLFHFIESILPERDTNPLLKDVAIRSIESILQSLELNWRDISAAYGELRVFCLTGRDAR